MTYREASSILTRLARVADIPIPGSFVSTGKLVKALSLAVKVLDEKARELENAEDAVVKEVK
jgi:hypothetical protein